MADKQIVTKKTVAKPATANDAQPATAPSARKTVAKKTVASPAPSAAVAQHTTTTAPAKPTATRTASPRSAATQGADDRGSVKKAAPTKAKAKAAKPNTQPTPDEQPLSLQGLAQVTPEQRLDMIREAAYYKAEKRNFAVGHEADDWNEAEHEIDELLAKARRIYGG